MINKTFLLCVLLAAAVCTSQTQKGALTITTASLPAGQVGVAYGPALLTATGGVMPYKWSVMAANVGNALPPGLSVGKGSRVGSNAIVGTPSISWRSYVTLLVKDSAGSNGSKRLLLVVTYPLLTAPSGPLPSATISVPYNYTLSARGGLTPYTWSISSGSLPSGLTMTALGNISGTPTTKGTARLQVSVRDSQKPPVVALGDVSIDVSDGTVAKDIYGGIILLPSPGGGTGYFRVEKDANNRWLFVDPLGNYFWMISSYVETTSWLQTTPTNVLTVKYGGNKTNWAINNNKRLLSWGFNAIGEYAITYVLPVNTNGSHGNANPVKLPFIPLINAMVDMQIHPALVGIPEKPKNMIAGVPSSIIVWRGSVMTDMFDPKVVTAYNNDAIRANTVTYTDGLASSPWIVGITTDDTDYLFGLKNRGDTPVSPHPNIGFIAAVTRFNYNGVGGPWLDNNLYSKYAWTCGYAGIDFGFGVGKGYLDSKYGTIAALNAAWGTSNYYTTFCSDTAGGGYGVGKGVLDENARHSWIGTDAYNLRGTNATVAADMNQFVYQYAYQYASTAVTAIRRVDTHHLIFGPAALGASGNEDRPQVLQAFAAAGIDVIQASASTTGDLSGAKATYDLIHKPMFLWYGIIANADSALYGNTSSQGVPDYATQGNRGIHYQLDLENFLAATASNGDRYMLGIDWWEHTDGNIREKTNWGLVSDRDNAYDGKEDVNYQVRDSGNYLTVPEDRSYGDFITPVTETNNSILQQLIYEGQH